MSYEVSPAREARNGSSSAGQRGGGVSACGIFGITIGAVALAFVVINLPDIYRYIKMTQM